MFSVLIPSYNHRPFLVECLLSALRSTLVTEVLLVDDGSSDGSPQLFELLERFSGRVRVLPTPVGENRGAHARLNQLVEAASNAWMAPLNSDDLFAPGRFEAIQRACNRGEADLFFGDLVLIDGQGCRLGLRNALRHNEAPWPQDWNLAEMARRRDWVSLLLLQNITATTTNMVFTKKLHAELGGFRDFRYCHDWDFALRAALQAKVSYAPAMMALYRLHGGNTIKEAADRVSREVRSMLATVVSDSPALRNDAGAMATLTQNHYLSPVRKTLLAVAIGDDDVRGALELAVARENLPIRVVGSAGQAPDAAYVYQPGPDGAAALRINDLREVVLALAVSGHDGLLLLRHAGEGVDAAGEVDAVVRRQQAGDSWREGAVRALHLYPLTQAEPTGRPTAATTPRSRPADLSVPMPAPILEPDPRPVVFVLPAFLAVGGVERLVIETMRHLERKFRFVVVNTEPLRPEQGSTHAEALQFAPVFDLAELASAEDRLRAMEILRDWYGPSLVWIVNGAPWQVGHAVQIRQLFRGVPIVDHQAYDHVEGWVNHLGDPGVRAADRFIAINQKIRATMHDRFGIAQDRIDLVYHGSDMSRVRRSATVKARVADHRRRFGLDPSRPVFGMIGRLTAQKRPLDLVALARRVGPDVQFVWVGMGELEAEVKAAAAPLPNMTLIAGQSDLRPIYEMLDGLIVTSEFEGLPIVLIEAMAMGLPALSTDVGAIKEVLDRYGSGMTFGPPGNIDALAEAYKAFQTALPGLSATAEREADRVAEDFSAARMAAEYEMSFQTAMADFGAA